MMGYLHKERRLTRKTHAFVDRCAWGVDGLVVVAGLEGDANFLGVSPHGSVVAALHE